MLDAVIQIVPLIAVFLAGFGLKRAKMLNAADGTSLLKLIFYAGAPALVLVSVLKVRLDATALWLGLLVPVIAAVTLAVLFVLRRSLLRRTDAKTFGALLAGTVVINTGFLLPFVERLYGAPGLALLVVVDSLYAFVTFGVAYPLAVRLGNDRPDMSFVFKKLLLAPPLWALCIALLCNLAGWIPPPVVMDTLGMVAKLVSPVILLALGLKFTLRIRRPRLLVLSMVLRFGLGMLIGLAFVRLLRLEGLTAQIALFASMAPIGFNSLTFAELEGLDVPFAASQVSVALVLALAASPLMVRLLAWL